MIKRLIILLFPVYLTGQLSTATLESNYDSYYSSESSSRYDALTSTAHQGDVYYYFGGIDGAIAMFQATGDTVYLNQVINRVNVLFGEANLASSFPNPSKPAYNNNDTDGPFVQYNDNFLAWDNHGGGITGQGSSTGGEAILYDGHGIRNIGKLLWVLYESPILLTLSNGRGGTFQDDYDYILNFTREHIWKKWWSRGSNSLNEFMRSRTWMTSHWANLSLYLYEVTKDEGITDVPGPNEYKEMFESFATSMQKYTSSMRGQLKPHPNRAGAYVWSGEWGSNTPYADFSHANAEVQYMIHAQELGYEFTIADMNALVLTLREGLDNSPDADFNNIPYRVNGVYNSADDNRDFIHHGWSMLGRFDEALQQDLEGLNSGQYTSSRYGGVFWGHLRYNRAHLDGTIQYPENYYNAGGEPPPPPPPPPVIPEGDRRVKVKNILIYRS